MELFPWLAGDPSPGEYSGKLSVSLAQVSSGDSLGVHIIPRVFTTGKMGELHGVSRLAKAQAQVLRGENTFTFPFWLPLFRYVSSLLFHLPFVFTLEPDASEVGRTFIEEILH